MNDTIDSEDVTLIVDTLHAVQWDFDNLTVAAAMETYAGELRQIEALRYKAFFPLYPHPSDFPTEELQRS